MVDKTRLLLYHRCVFDIIEVSMECRSKVDRVSIEARWQCRDPSLHLVCTALNFKLTFSDSDWTLQMFASSKCWSPRNFGQFMISDFWYEIRALVVANDVPNSLCSRSHQVELSKETIIIYLTTSFRKQHSVLQDKFVRILAGEFAGFTRHHFCL